MGLNIQKEIGEFEAIDLHAVVKSAPAIVIFGAGNGGQQLLEVLSDRSVKPDFFCDNDSKLWGTTIRGLRVLSPSELATMNNIPLILIASNWAREIADQLAAQGNRNFVDFTCWDDRWDKNFNQNLINNCSDEISEVYQLMEDDWSKELYLSLIKYRLNADPRLIRETPHKWYAHPMVSAESGDTVFDVGSFDGKTSIGFAEQVGQSGRVISFEPDEVNYRETETTLSAKDVLGICEVQNIGFWSSNTQMSFMSDEKTASQNRISEDGDQTVQLVMIDCFAEEKKVTPDLIKMDIEGAELHAIKGGGLR